MSLAVRGSFVSRGKARRRGAAPLGLALGGRQARRVFVRDLTRGLTPRATLDTAGGQAVGTTAKAAGLSKDGRYVVITAAAGNLVPDDTNQQRDVFVRDLRHGITTRASRRPGQRLQRHRRDLGERPLRRVPAGTNGELQVYVARVER